MLAHELAKCYHQPWNTQATKEKHMLSYIRSIEDMINLGYNANKNTINIKNAKGRTDVWRKVFMNGDDVGFFVLSRK